MGVGAIMPFLEHKSCGILTGTVWSVMVGHVVLAIHIVHSLETDRDGPISRQITVLSEHNLFTLTPVSVYTPISVYTNGCYTA